MGEADTNRAIQEYVENRLPSGCWLLCLTLFISISPADAIFGFGGGTKRVQPKDDVSEPLLSGKSCKQLHTLPHPIQTFDAHTVGEGMCMSESVCGGEGVCVGEGMAACVIMFSILLFRRFVLYPTGLPTIPQRSRPKTSSNVRSARALSWTQKAIAPTVRIDQLRIGMYHKSPI